MHMYLDPKASASARAGKPTPRNAHLDRLFSMAETRELAAAGDSAHKGIIALVDYRLGHDLDVFRKDPKRRHFARQALSDESLSADYMSLRFNFTFVIRSDDGFVRWYTHPCDREFWRALKSDRGELVCSFLWRQCADARAALGGIEAWADHAKGKAPGFGSSGASNG